MAFDAGFVAGEFQAELFVAIRGGDNVVFDLPLAGPLVARIALQFAGEVGVWHFDPPQVRLVREAVVVHRFLRRLSGSGRRFFVGLLPARGKRIQQRRAQGETTKDEGDFYFFHPDHFGQIILARLF